MTKGNILLVGLEGTGRKTAVKLASHIAGTELLTPHMTSTYSMDDWQTDIKKVSMIAGVESECSVFLFSDVQV